MHLSIVMPAFNEEANIRGVINDHLRIVKELPKAVSDWELIVIDDGSQDSTGKILEEIAQCTPKLRILKHEKNQGIFATCDHLYDAAQGTHIYVTGSDGQWPTSNLVQLLKVALERGSDLVVGVRPNRTEVYSVWRSIISHTYNSLPRLLFGVETRDAGSNKLGKREIFAFDLISHSPFVEAERIIQAELGGYRVDFVPIEFLPRSAGKARGAKLSYVVASVRDCFRCFWVYRVRGVAVTKTKE